MQQTASNMLMIRPKHFGFNVQTAENNVFQGQTSLSNREVQQNAVIEFDAFVQELELHGVHVIVVDDTEHPIKPDAVFPNNWFCSMQDGTLFLFPMFAPNRRLERREDVIAQLQTKFEITKVEDWSPFEKEIGILEGTGSIVFDHINQYLFACLSPRTDEMLVEKFAKKVGYKPVIFTAEDEQGMLIYHTNVMMHIGVDYAVVCLDTIRTMEEKEIVMDKLSLGGRKIVDITLNQMSQYAGNMLQVQNHSGKLFTVMSKAAYESLDAYQIKTIASSSQILPVDIGTIETVGGGSARCMMAEIFFNARI